MTDTLGQVARKWWGRLCAGAVIVAAMAAPAGAQQGQGFESGNRLYGDCTAKDANQMLCLGYIAGIADAATGGNRVNGFTVCSPSDVSLKQVRDVAVQYLTKHPELRNFGAAGVVARALSEAYPCSK